MPVAEYERPDAHGAVEVGVAVDVPDPSARALRGEARREDAHVLPRPPVLRLGGGGGRTGRWIAGCSGGALLRRGGDHAVGEAGGGQAFVLEDVVEQAGLEPAAGEGDRVHRREGTEARQRLGDDAEQAAGLEVVL